jgi:oligopeptide/dipeptide ABC transporter ATP-binding protein
MEEKILEVRNLKKYFPTPRGFVRAVDGINFFIKKGETLALVGESGSGKTTTGHLIMGFYTPDEGSIRFNGIDITIPLEKRPKELKRMIQIVFQDPGSSLNPKRAVKDIIEEPLKIHEKLSKFERFKRILEILNYVGLSEDYLFKKPVELGGGEKQLVAIARAIAPNPSFIALDEATSALDVSAQARILKTLYNIQKEFNVSYLLITHDLSVVRNVSHRVCIMYLGQILESASTEEFFKNPLHPYTQMLLSSIPVISDEEAQLIPKKIESRGEIPSATNPPPGCRFHPRCPFAMEICKEKEPPEFHINKESNKIPHTVKCWLYAEQIQPLQFKA